MEEVVSSNLTRSTNHSIEPARKPLTKKQAERDATSFWRRQPQDTTANDAINKPTAREKIAGGRTEMLETKLDRVARTVWAS